MISMTHDVPPLDLMKTCSHGTRSTDHNDSLSCDPAQPNPTQLLPHQVIQHMGHASWHSLSHLQMQHHLRHQGQRQLKQSIHISWAPLTGGEPSNTFSVRCLCRLCVPGVWPGVSVLRKCQNTDSLCARTKAGSPVSHSAESSPSPPRTEGPRQKLMLWSSA